MTDVLEFHKQGYNCAEAIIKAINEEKGLNLPVSMASPFGGGMAVGSTCGAIAGALMAVGAMHGRENSAEKNNSGKIARVILNDLSNKYGTLNCRELKQNSVSCAEIIEYSYNLLREHGLN